MRNRSHTPPVLVNIRHKSTNRHLLHSPQHRHRQLVFRYTTALLIKGQQLVPTQDNRSLARPPTRSTRAQRRTILISVRFHSHVRVVKQLLRHNRPTSNLNIRHHVPLARPQVSPSNTTRSNQRRLLRTRQIRKGINRQPSHDVANRTNRTINTVLSRRHPRLPHRHNRPPKQILVSHTGHVLRRRHVRLLITPRQRKLRLNSIGTRHINTRVHVPQSRPTRGGQVSHHTTNRRLNRRQTITAGQPRYIRHRLRTMPYLRSQRPILQPHPNTKHRHLAGFHRSPYHHLFRSRPHSVKEVHLVSVCHPPTPKTATHIATSSRSTRRATSRHRARCMRYRGRS